jgi:hypothetical protein
MGGGKKNIIVNRKYIKKIHCPKDRQKKKPEYKLF